MEFLFTDTALNRTQHNVSLHQDWVGSDFPTRFECTHEVLQGGKQAQSELITLTIGDLCIRVSPTRGMGIIDAQYNALRMGWKSPVSEIVNPAFMDLGKSGGKGWLEGFNELVARCGFQWAGHQGEDSGQQLALHGEIQNTPASLVKLTVLDQYPFTVRLSGRADEKRFKGCAFEVWMHLDIVPGEAAFSVHDELFNRASYPSEYQVIYHNNFGLPLLNQDYRIAAPAREVSPFNHGAVKGLSTWSEIDPPTVGFGEEVYNLYPYADEEGRTLAALIHSRGEEGVAVRYNTHQLPVLTLWKNTDTVDHGYVIGIEPGTGFSYNRSHQRSMGLVPIIEAGGRQQFDLRFEFLLTADSVDSVLNDIAALQIKEPVLHTTPM